MNPVQNHLPALWACIQKRMLSNPGTFFLMLCFRIASVFFVQTYFVPDEYWQSLEVAHFTAFDFGFITWEWKLRLRNALYPLTFSWIYSVMGAFGLDSPSAIIIVPRLIQATLTAFADYSMFMWLNKKKWALFVILTSWFWFYIGSRTLINTLEACLNAYALYWYPWNSKDNDGAYLTIAFMICYMRPTSTIFWTVMMFYHFANSAPMKMAYVLLDISIIGSIVFFCGIVIDSYFYDIFTLTPLRFLLYNITNDLASLYGTHPWYWYILIGIPSILSLSTVIFCFGVFETFYYKGEYPKRFTMLVAFGAYLCSMSLIDHKEIRFMAPMLPVFHYVVSDVISKWSSKISKANLWAIAVTILISNVIPMLYFSTIHQAGPIRLINKLRHLAWNYKDEFGNEASFLFLMPCHATPFYSHIHKNISMQFIQCDPFIDPSESIDVFFEYPDIYLDKYYGPISHYEMPTHVMCFDDLPPKIEDFLQEYKLLETIPHSQFTFHAPNTSKNILIYERQTVDALTEER